ncbi:MAG: alpha/beta fold hydrolase [Longispora sp.]|nr:alpha/beta fold hydrolase [Longispora sp. (in: high G+C Gram-positive bacteria)]
MFSDVDIPDLLTVDLGGFGDSNVPEAEPSLDVLADEVLAELDRNDLDRVVLGGVSIGGYIAMAFIRRYRERVAGLVLVDTKASADTPEAAANRLKMAESVLAGGDDAEALAPKMLAPESPLLPRVMEMVRAANPEAIAWAQRAMAARPDSFDELEHLAIPALIIVGEHDTLTPPSEAEKLEDAIPYGELVTIEGAGHLTPLERPEEFSLAVRRFLERWSLDD